MRMNIAGGACAIAIAISASAAVAAPEAGRGVISHNPPAEARIWRYTGVPLECADPAVLGEIAASFAGREQEYWASGLALANFERAWETGFRSNGPSYVPRRYCSADAIFNDGARRRVVYNVGEALGFIGLGDGVTWCVVGLDRNRAFGPKCRAAGP
jgi:hypothetical protein